MDENKNFPEEFEETPWIYPLVKKGTVGIPEIAARVAKKMDIEPSEVEEYLNQYNDTVMQRLRDGETVSYFGMGDLIPEMDEDGELVSWSFEPSEEFQQIIYDTLRNNPSHN